ncbi:hypothetical protein BKH46_02850 [Helicobacter sp. 12S02634-8]|nr:hypothetical protein BKH46_02850 [Helicobacter sp. 12S02634-8]
MNPSHPSIPCAILTGGKSSRMQSNKALLPFGEAKSLLAYQYQKMSAIFPEVFIVCKHNQDFGLKAPYLYEKSEVFSPLVGIAHTLKTLQAPEVFFTSVDTPFLELKTIKALCNIQGAYDIIYPRSQDRGYYERGHYLIGRWRGHLYKDLEQAIAQKSYKISAFVTSHKSYFLDCGNGDEFYNLNTPKDYHHALKILKDSHG